VIRFDRREHRLVTVLLDGGEAGLVPVAHLQLRQSRKHRPGAREQLLTASDAMSVSVCSGQIDDRHQHG
jgi:hypothetical protein